jgi:hypothetical protein
MNSPKWNDIQALFDAAVELDREARSAFLHDLAAADRDAHRELAALLDADERNAVSAVSLGIARSAVAPLADAAFEGQTVGPYRIETRVGHGAMGGVARRWTVGGDGCGGGGTGSGARRHAATTPASAARSASRARWRRERTVPTGTASRAAISA